MLLAVDIGNSAIKFGLFDGDNLTEKFSITTKRNSGSGEIKLDVGERMRDAESAIVCSVVPEIGPAMSEFLRNVTGTDPILVNNSFDFGLKINYQPLESLGTDRLVNIFAAVEKYGAPCIVCSLGTATTIDVVNSDREFLGGIIAPGMDAMSEALRLKAPRLPTVAAQQPANVLANSTEQSIQSGIYYGYVAMVEGLIERIRSESGTERVVATGGNAGLPEIARMMTVDPDLLLSGLVKLSRR